MAFKNFGFEIAVTELIAFNPVIFEEKGYTGITLSLEKIKTREDPMDSFCYYEIYTE